MTQFLLQMGAIFNVSFLIICAVLSQEMVVAFDDNLELSSVPHNRQKRMEAPRETSHVHDLPPLLAHNLREVHLTAPTCALITWDGCTIGAGFAIHPYLVITHSIDIGDGCNYGVKVYDRYLNSYKPQRVETCRPDPDDRFVVFLLKDPVLLDHPIHDAFADYPNSVFSWAQHAVEEWRHTHLPKLHALLAQNLYQLHFDHPTTVQITSNGAPTGPGYAIHPYLVITFNHFIEHKFGVALREGNGGELRHYRLQTQYTNIHQRIVVIQLLDPILLRQDAPGALAGHSPEALAWARGVAENWKHTMLNNPANCYHANSV